MIDSTWELYSYWSCHKRDNTLSLFLFQDLTPFFFYSKEWGLEITVSPVDDFAYGRVMKPKMLSNLRQCVSKFLMRPNNSFIISIPDPIFFFSSTSVDRIYAYPSITVYDFCLFKPTGLDVFFANSGLGRAMILIYPQENPQNRCF